MSLKGDAIIQYCETYIGRICVRDKTEKRNGREDTPHNKKTQREGDGSWNETLKGENIVERHNKKGGQQEGDIA